MKKPTVMTVVGTRPEIIRLSRLIPKFDEEFNHVVIHTGQNYDPMLSDIFFEELRLKQPDEYLNVDHASLGRTLGDLFIKFEETLHKHKPDGVFILGDTNSSLVAILAKRMQIPVYHWEAGNRSFDENVPEETNRKIVDHTAHFNIAYSYPAESNLIAEGLPRNRILMSGSPMKEILDFYWPQIENSKVLTKVMLSPSKYFLVSLHRQENVDNSERLREAISTFRKISESWGYPILISTHPRTLSRLKRLGLHEASDRIIFHEPFGFFDYIKLQKEAYCVLSDSGTVSEESAILDFPAITLREKIERPEALSAGTIRATGVSFEKVVEGINWATTARSGNPPGEYLVGSPSEDVLNLVRRTVRNFGEWSGVERLSSI